MKKKGIIKLKKGAISRTEDFIYTRLLPYKYFIVLKFLRFITEIYILILTFKNKRFKRIALILSVSLAVTLLILILVILPVTLQSKHFI